MRGAAMLGSAVLAVTAVTGLGTLSAAGSDVFPPPQVAEPSVAPGTAVVPGPGALSPDSASEAAVARRVEIVRTEYGVPHVYARDLEAMGFALGWLQSEDYGDVVPLALLRARGRYAQRNGRDFLDSDFDERPGYLRAVETFHRLEPETRAVYRGFAAGVRHYVRLHADDFPDWLAPDFTAYDAHARDVQGWSRGDARSFVRAYERASSSDDASPSSLSSPSAGISDEDDIFRLDGSNAWALHGSRSGSGHTILLRNPHLSWGAGYYEAHVRVPGVVDFYGDFRIGTAFGIIGGFNRHLGWATTNNYPTWSQVYALEVDPERDDHVILDGASVPLRPEELVVPYRTASGGEATETRTRLWSPFGPVIHRDGDHAYVLKDPRDGEFRRGEQFLEMMRATSLEDWLDVMRMQAHPSSNFTYADAAGNIAHLYNARLPALPHAPTGDTAAVLVRSSDDVWTRLTPFDELPLYVNPPGGYVQQANDTPDYTNLHVPLDRDTVDVNLPDRRLRLRSQLSLKLIGGADTLTLEEVVRRKHSPRMLLAERTVDELLTAVREDGSGGPGGADGFGARDRSAGDAEPGGWSEAVDALAGWDRTAAATSRGGVLFEMWWERYTDRVDGDERFRIAWSPDAPTVTPTGIGDVEAAIAAFGEAVVAMADRGWSPDVPWGEVHRVRRGEVDAPVSGCPGDMGCFRTLSFRRADDGTRVANRGDGWVFAVEFGPVPRAYTVLAYGQSRHEESPHHADQAALFARGEMKPIAWTDEAIEVSAIRRYTPGADERR